MSRSNTTELVGSVALVDDDFPDRFLPDLLWEIRIRKDSPLSAEFLADFLQSDYGRRLLQAAAMGTSGSMKKLSMARVRAIEVPVVSRDQQVAWALVRRQYLANLATADRLLGAKRAFKRALLHELLTGRRRFPEFAAESSWETVRVSDVATERSIRAGDSGGQVFSCTKHHGLVPSLEYFGKQVFSRNLENYKVVLRGEFAYATNHIEEGSIGVLMNADRGLVSPMYTVFAVDPERVLPAFLYSVLKTERYRQMFQGLTSGSVDRRGALRWSLFRTIEIPLPRIAEQRRIAAVIETIDREISLLHRLHNDRESHKRALMLSLLSGAVPRSEDVPALEAINV